MATVVLKLSVSDNDAYIDEFTEAFHANTLLAYLVRKGEHASVVGLPPMSDAEFANIEEYINVNNHEDIAIDVSSEPMSFTTEKDADTAIRMAAENGCSDEKDWRRGHAVFAYITAADEDAPTAL
jgi:hypothetical protein